MAVACRRGSQHLADVIAGADVKVICTRVDADGRVLACPVLAPSRPRRRKAAALAAETHTARRCTGYLARPRRRWAK